MWRLNGCSREHMSEEKAKYMEKLVFEQCQEISLAPYGCVKCPVQCQEGTELFTVQDGLSIEILESSGN